MNYALKIGFLLSFALLTFSCNPTKPMEEQHPPEKKEMTAQDILGNPDYLAISYGGYRENTREIQPTVAQIKEDMKILAAANIKILRTYNTKFKHASTLLEAIRELKREDPAFEMYVMLGAWMDCENAFKANPNHEAEDEVANAAEIQRAVQMAQAYPDIVKIIAVGNEAMVKWAASYFVQPWVILKWVNHLQSLKASGDLPKDLWITSSDNFASWGGGGSEYHVPDLEALIKVVDYVSMHTYPMHDTHYNPEFWGVLASETGLTDVEKIEKAMERARDYAGIQFENTSNYIKGISKEKPIHIGETGWASADNGLFNPEGSKATDEYKEGRYYELMRDWTKEVGISCFYFQAFDEPWKDARNPGGSENYFGLFTVDGKAKYAMWDKVDQGHFEGLGRNGQPITKTFDGNKTALLKEVALPPLR
jgi:exo-beta-1,3-glucanase (GH17 family)